MVFENRIHREWVVADQMAILRRLGLDPHRFAERIAAARLSQGLLAIDIGETRPMLGQYPPEAEPDTSIAATELERHTLRWLHDVWNRKMFGRIRQVHAPTAMDHGPLMSELHGPASVIHQVMGLVGSLPDAFAPQHVCSTPCAEGGTKVAVRWVLGGHHLGHGILASGRAHRQAHLGHGHLAPPPRGARADRGRVVRLRRAVAPDAAQAGAHGRPPRRARSRRARSRRAGRGRSCPLTHDHPTETRMNQHLRAALAATALPLGAGAALAECGIEEGSVRILANDFDALGVVVEAAKECASDGVEVTANMTTEHKSIQVPALTVDPAEYTVAMVANNSIVPLMNEGLIRPLDDLVAEHGQDLASSQLITLDGRVVAVAFMGNAQHLFLRSDVLEEVGVEPPTSYEEVLAAAEAIREAGRMENPLAATDQAGWYLAAEFVNMYLGTGAEFFEPGSAELAIDGPEGIEALEMMRALTEYMGPEFLTYSDDEMSQLFVADEVAVMNQWGSLANSLIGPDAPSPEIAGATELAPAPTVAGGSIPAAALWWDGFSIASNISEEDATASFRAMVHAIRPEVARANPDAATWLIPGVEPTPAAEGVLATAAAGVRPYPMSPSMGLLHTALGAELPDHMQGLESAEQAPADVEAAYRTAAAEAGFLD